MKTEEQTLIKAKLAENIDCIDPATVALATLELEKIYGLPFAIRVSEETNTIEVINLSFITNVTIKDDEIIDLKINPEGIYKGEEGINHLMHSQDYDNVQNLTIVKEAAQFLEMVQILNDLNIENARLLQLAYLSLQIQQRNIEKLKAVSMDKDILSKIFDSKYDIDLDCNGTIDRAESQNHKEENNHQKYKEQALNL